MKALTRNKIVILLIVSLLLLPIILSKSLSLMEQHRFEKGKMLLNESLTSHSPLLCYKINYKQFRDDCFNEFGTRQNNSNFCDEIKELPKKNSCFHTIAVGKRDVQLCEKLVTEKKRKNRVFLLDMPRVYPASPKNRCIEEINKLIIEDAITSKNYNNCKENEECEYKIALLLNDQSHCSQLAGLKNACFSDIAYNLNDTSLCNNLESQENIEDCIFNVAKKVQDYKQCYLIHDETKNKECLEYFYCNDRDDICYPSNKKEYRDKIKEIVKHGMIDDCKELPQLSTEFCYFEFAMKNNDISLCNNLKFSWKAWNGLEYFLDKECRVSVAILSHDISKCETVGNRYELACKQQTLNDLGKINLSSEIEVRSQGFTNVGSFGNYAHLYVKNLGETYLLSNYFDIYLHDKYQSQGCYRPGVIMPDTDCAFTIYDAVENSLDIYVFYKNESVKI